MNAHHRGLPAEKRGKAWTEPQRAADGRPLCRWCGVVIRAKRRQTFCSDACVEQWKLRSNPQFVRHKVKERDRGVCALCRIDTAAAQRAWWETRDHSRYPADQRAWEADHVVPLIDGGSHELENIRTLCVRCHSVVTA